MKFFSEIITEEDFANLAEKPAHNILNFAACFSGKNNHNELNMKHYMSLVKESMELEDFLDDHGARNNKKWVFLGELVASIRNFSKTAYTISHIIRRINHYKLEGKHVKAFTADAKKKLQFLNESIILLFISLIKEAETLNLKIPKGQLSDEDFIDSIAVKTLPQNIDESESTDLKEKINRVATEYNNSFNASTKIIFARKVPAKNLDSDYIPDKINEETLRQIESTTHNAQSMYDTYIHKTVIESQNNNLRSLRGHISITLHLLGIAKELCHFIERHETTVRKESSQQKISKIIKRKKVIDTVINFSLYYYTFFAKQGSNIADSILSEFTVLNSATVSVPEGLGFHLRPSTLVAKISNHYSSKLLMIVNGKEFDAGSVIDIMWAGGMIKKENITEVEFRGDKHAVRDIQYLSKSNYGEDTMGNSTPLPDELTYLRKE